MNTATQAASLTGSANLSHPHMTAPTYGPKIALDDAPLNRFHIKIAALTFGAHLTEGYILGSIGYSLNSMKQSLPMDTFWTGMLGSSALLGVFLGSLIFGCLSDKIGRQRVFLCSFLIITVASFLQFFVPSIAMLCLLRLIIGIGIGGDFAVGHAILAEIAPRKYRGVLLGSFSAIWTVGYVVANVLGMQFADASPDAWRWLLASACVPAFLVVILRKGTPESPRWLMSKGRSQEAQAIVTKHFGKNIEIRQEEPKDCVVNSGNFSRLFSRELIGRTFFNATFFVCLVIPYYAVYTFLPTILDIIRVPQGGFADLMLNAFLILGALLGIWLTIKLSRRAFLIGSFAVTGLSLALMSMLPESSTVLLVLCFSVFTLVMSAFSNLVGVYPPECFPTDVRASGVGFSIACSRLGSAAGTFLLPFSIESLGFSTTMLCLAGVLFFGMMVSWWLAPETKHLTLAECGHG
jgi:putative MFS transporter